ncbi:MAG: PQQ-binding-like beta-propeller repeat protein [Myxococcota bacterium]
MARAHRGRLRPRPLDRAVAGVIIVAHPTKGIVALDLADGRVRWRDAARPAVDAPLVAGGGRVAALGLDATLRLLDAADGRELWRAAWPDDPFSYWEARVVGARVVRASRTLVVLDAADGRELLRDPTPPPRYSGVSAASPTLFMRASFGAGVEALDPVRGTPMWKAKGALGDLEAVGGALFGCGAGVGVRALDLANGADLWSWGLPRCREPWPSERRNWRAAAGPDGTHLVARGPHGVVGFAADAAAEGGLAPERATLVGVARIDGIRRAGVRVRVADKTALTDALGRYARTVRARGMVHVALDRDEVRRLTPRPCPGDAERAVELTGAGRYRADLDARGYGYECDRACHCD